VRREEERKGRIEEGKKREREEGRKRGREVLTQKKFFSSHSKLLTLLYLCSRIWKTHL